MKQTDIKKDLLLTAKQIAYAIFLENCKLHSVLPKQAEAHPELLSPDGAWRDIIPDFVLLESFNGAVAQAQQDADFNDPRVVVLEEHKAIAAIEKVLKKYREHNLKGDKIDFRNFAAHDILNALRE